MPSAYTSMGMHGVHIVLEYFWQQNCWEIIPYVGNVAEYFYVGNVAEYFYRTTFDYGGITKKNSVGV